MKRSFTQYLLIVVRGMGMGAADVIPGVSGGTIAFITGIYEELINSIKSVNAVFLRKLFTRGIGPAWTHMNGNFLAAVLGGILLSLFSLARLISYLLATHPLLVWSFFFGLIVGSAIYVGRKIKKWNLFSLFMLIAGTSLAYYITISTPASTTDALWFIFISGCIAISAMILPGISGSFILLLLGKYAYMLEALKDLKVLVLGTFALGCVVGILSFSHVISWLFRKYPNATMALLSGFMIGSLNKLWPWKEVLESRMNTHGEWVPFIERSISPARYQELFQTDPMLLQVGLSAVAGLALIFIFEHIARWKQYTD
jgi:putative membrane protein